ncbi:MAG TPA: hypothetical protein VGO67_24520 [Verrucomicrobiae bacterium]|jgi:hypothetical protein
MLDLANIHDKKFAVVFVENNDTPDENWTVLVGVAKWCAGHLSIYRGDDIPEFPIPDDTLDRVKPVLPELREILEEAVFYTMLLAGPLPPDIDPSEITHTGLNLRNVEEGSGDIFRI